MCQDTHHLTRSSPPNVSVLSRTERRVVSLKYRLNLLRHNCVSPVPNHPVVLRCCFCPAGNLCYTQQQPALSLP